MKWKKGSIDANEDKTMDCWRSECHGYIISQNIWDGTKWLFEVCVYDKGKEKYIGEESTLKKAKSIAEEYDKKEEE